jgi:hypothetical protein
MNDQELLEALDRRLGPLHARQRLGIERDHEAQTFGQGLNFFHPENAPLMRHLMAAVLMMSGLYWRGRRNAADLRLRRNAIVSANLPGAFDGFTILQLSDLHIDMMESLPERIARLLDGAGCDTTVLTGDYRALTTGSCDKALAGLARVRDAIKGPIYGVLGNHDSIAMVPEMEVMGFQMLMNECQLLERGGEVIYLAGIDDAHYFRVDNIEKAASPIPRDAFSVLLSHTPEIYRQAAHADFDLLLSGHTHGGQICLPGGVPITLDSVLPRRMGAGAWRYQRMTGYTSAGAGCSIIPVRFNCPPEITLHRLQSAA